MIQIREMTLNDVDSVYEIEKSQFIVPWTKDAFEKELTSNFCAIYFVALVNEKIVGYGGLWHVINEGHITNIAVLDDYKRKGIGTKLLEKIIEVCVDREMIGITLECSTVNEKALNLYKKYGFEIEGERKAYYEVTKEDCYIMWKYF